MADDPEIRSSSDCTPDHSLIISAGGRIVHSQGLRDGYPLVFVYIGIDYRSHR